MTQPDYAIREMAAEDYPEVAALWRIAEGVGLDEGTDSEAGVGSYLQRNPGLSFVARQEGQLVGAVLCGHDGRRGYLHHLAVAESARRQGIGRALVDHCLAGLAAEGINRCNLFLFADNEPGEQFWRHAGWNERRDLKLFQHRT